MTGLRIVRSADERTAEALRFLRHLWPGDDLAKRDAKLVLWRPKRGPVFSPNLVEVATRSVALSDTGEDVYFSACAMRADFEPPKERRGARGTAADLRLAGSLWLDLDVKPGSFDSRESALVFLNNLPLVPTALVNSGTGVHAWWALREVVEFDGPEAIAEFDALSRGWLEYVRNRASGIQIDPVSDLARVMRLPGTIRYKGEPGVSTSLIYLSDDRRYNPSDFAEHAVKMTARAPSTIGAGTGLTMEPDAYPPSEKFAALLANDQERFAKSWARVARKDLKDNSASGHDMSLASIAIRAGWTDQEVIDLLVAARRNHRDEDQNLNYFSYTTLKARAGYIDEISATVAEEKRAEFVARIAQAEAAPPGSDERKHAAIEAAKQYTGIDLVSIVRYVPEPYFYALEVEGGRLYRIGEAADFRRWDRWTDAGIDLNFKITTQRPKPAEWLRCVQLLSEFARCEEQMDFSSNERNEAMLASYLAQFGDSVICENATKRAERAFRRAPYVEDDFLFISGAHLLAWYERVARGRGILRYDELRKLGFVPWTVRAISPKKATTTRRYERAPLSRLPFVRATYGLEEPPTDLPAEGGAE